MGDAEEPVGQAFRPADVGGAADQHQEGGLEGVVGVVGVARHPPADAQYHRPVALHQGGERGLLPAVAEPFEQLPVAEPAAVAGQRLP
jgi:hypothetical protein